MGRITRLIENGACSRSRHRGAEPATDRVMICGSMSMLKDVKALVEASLRRGSHSHPRLCRRAAFVG